MNKRKLSRGALIFSACFGLALTAFALKAKGVWPEKPQYLKRSGKQWDGNSRFMGEVINAPSSYKITIEGSSKKNSHVLKLSGESHVYVSPWLPLGKYHLTITAKGWEKYPLDVELKSKTDCVINIRFGRE